MNVKMKVTATLMRVVLGIIFFAHGWDKYQSGLGNVGEWFDSVGLPNVLVYFVAALEIIGGLSLMLGLLTKYLAALFIVLMIGATWSVKLAMGLLNGYELDLALMMLSLYFVFADERGLGVDQLLFGGKHSSPNVM